MNGEQLLFKVRRNFLIQEIENKTSQWSIDRHRIYVTGLSAGAVMAVILGATYPDIFAAIGVHSGAEYDAIASPLSGGVAFLQGGPDPIQQGKAAFKAMGSFARVVPTIVFHGTEDPVSRPINGKQVIQQWMETDFLASHGTNHADFNHPSSTMKGRVPGGHSYTVYKWNATNGNEVEEYWFINGMRLPGQEMVSIQLYRYSRPMRKPSNVYILHASPNE